MANSYEWKYCTVGGVTRIKIDSGEDIAHLDELDQKLWTVLSCPVTGLEYDEKTLRILDTDSDGKVRVNEVVAAANWLTSILNDPDLLLKQEDTLPLEAFNKDNEEGLKLYNSARQILENLGLDKKEISLADASDSAAIFAKTSFNGDGIITAWSTDDAAQQEVIASAIATVGAVTDRSGLPGIDAALLEKFYASCADYKAWKEAGVPDVFPYGDATASAFAACEALKAKIGDYFMRSKLAAFSSDSTATLDVSAARIAEISAKDLSCCQGEIAAYPLARIDGSAVLPLAEDRINPAWQSAFATLKALVFDVDFPGKEGITESEWNAVLAKFAGYTSWCAAKKGTEVESLGLELISKILQEDRKAALLSLIAEDKALEAEALAIDSVEKLLRLCRDFYKLLKNFVTFTDFYSRKTEDPAVFQAGKLYIDQRCTELCIKVSDMSNQSDVSALSGMYILYCTCTSKTTGKTLQIAAVLTDGDVDDLRVGKNAIFYDMQGNDYDAVVTKILDNPVSIKQAFWAPYKKLARWINDKIDKAAAEKDSKGFDALTAAAENVGDKKNPASPFDIAKFAGIFAAIGMAVGFIGEFLVKLATGINSTPFWKLIVYIVAIILVISGPSMFIAWRKLRKRNLAPVLNANGWAINSNILVNIRFGATFTSLARYPKLNLVDPFAKKKMEPWKKWLIGVASAVVVLVGLFAGLYFTNNLEGIGLPCSKAGTEAEVPAAEAVAAPAAGGETAD